MIRYEHTQRSYLLHWLVIPVLVVVVGSVLLAGVGLGVWLLVAVYVVAFAWLIATFSMLTVLVDGEQIRVYFGRGWPRKTILRSAVASIRQVRNRWWYGVGIRWIPKGARWNVWGLDAVELELMSGRIFRIGTDDAGGLLAALAL